MTNKSVRVFLQNLALLHESFLKLFTFLLQATPTAMPSFCPLA